MSVMVSVTQSLTLVEGGVTVVDIENSLTDYEVDVHGDFHLRLAPAASMVFDVAATTVLSGWAAIAGFVLQINDPAYGELTFDAAGLEPLQVGPGPMNAGRCDAQYLKITNTSAVQMNGKLYLFGRV